MSIDRDDSAEREVRLASMIREFREAQTRRSMKSEATVVKSKPDEIGRHSGQTLHFHSRGTSLPLQSCT
jgi:hypothetical protein